MAESSPDGAIDELYKLPLDRFVAAREDLARRSDREQARAVRGLAKPTAVAWALNQLYWSARPTFDRLVEAAARLREAQANALLRRQHDFPAANAAHRRALGEAVRETSRFLDAAGHQPTQDALRSITAALESLPWSDRPGRLGRPPSSTGFGALAGLPEAAPAPEPPPQAAPPAPQPSAPARHSPRPTLVHSATNRSAPPSPATQSPAPPPSARQPPALRAVPRPREPAPSAAELRRSAEAERRERRERQAREALAGAQAAAAAAADRLRESRDRLARAQEAAKEARVRFKEAERELDAARAAHRASGRADAAARAAVRKAEAAAGPRRRQS